MSNITFVHGVTVFGFYPRAFSEIRSVQMIIYSTFYTNQLTQVG